MKTLFQKSKITTALFIAGTLCIACDNTSEKHQTETLAIAEEPIEHTVLRNIETRDPIVFISGFDKGSETYYKDARAYFKEQKLEVIDGKYSLEEIINWLNKNALDKSYGEIHVVNKSNPFTGLSLETVVKGKLITTKSLQDVITNGSLPTLNNAVNKNTKIILHANGLGNNKELMNTFKNAFYSNEMPNVIASPYNSIFNGEFSKHYLAKSFYVFYPTANSPGKIDLSKEIAKKYPEEKDIDWFDAINNEVERYVGEPYYTQFNIPVKFELDFHNSDEELPTFKIQEEIMDYIEQKKELYTEFQKMNIPLEKFRWSYQKQNSTITIKGIATTIVVLKPIIKQYGELEYITPDTNNKRLYAIK
jgi:hypothetical protein